MREFFKGWRRKAGCVTLVMACAVTISLIRARIVNDDLYFPFIPSQWVLHSIHSTKDGISWRRLKFLDDPRADFSSRTQWRTSTTTESERLAAMGRGFQTKSTSFLVLVVRKSSNPFYIRWKEDCWYVPHWSIVLPLTLLSAYLILCKPRKRKAGSGA